MKSVRVRRDEVVGVDDRERVGKEQAREAFPIVDEQLGVDGIVTHEVEG
jgi:hypothetical protein